jgi:sarcosine oxidase subunit gamma
MIRKEAGSMDDLSSARHSPLPSVTAGVRWLPPASRFILRGKSAVMSAAGAAIGVDISNTPLRSATRADRVALWLGPDEQLLLASVADGDMTWRQLQAALATQPHSLVDVSHRQMALEVSGPQASNLLNAGCPLDLHIKSFPVGMCTRTVLGKCDIVLWRKSATSFHLEVWRSFAEYASRFLAEAGETL